MTELEDKAREIAIAFGLVPRSHHVLAGMRYAAEECARIADELAMASGRSWLAYRREGREHEAKFHEGAKLSLDHFNKAIRARFGATEKPDGNETHNVAASAVSQYQAVSAAHPAPLSARAALVEKARVWRLSACSSPDGACAIGDDSFADFAAAHAAELERENARLRADVATFQGMTELENKAGGPCKQALDNLWRDVILARNLDYGDWEYPGQAYRHLLAEFNDLRAERDRAWDEAIEAACCAMTAKHSGWRSDWVAEACQIVRALRRGGEEQRQGSSVVERRTEAASSAGGRPASVPDDKGDAPQAEAPEPGEATLATPPSASGRYSIPERAGSTPAPGSTLSDADVLERAAEIQERLGWSAATPGELRSDAAKLRAQAAQEADPFEAAAREWIGDHKTRVHEADRQKLAEFLRAKFGGWQRALASYADAFEEGGDLARRALAGGPK